ncbi:MAG: M18 family aminopeptidase [Lachnospiraceae bacterium]|nr:M18 family aminopeptidase [Lachnospiraceae bacterium]
MNSQTKKTNNALFDFINNSPTCFHAVENLATAYEKAGFLALSEKESWNIAPGGKYFVRRNGSSIIGFTIPKEEVNGFHLSASHSDSPCFKLKQIPVTRTEKYLKLNVEKYGGMIMSTWLDRPLTIAGRIFTREPAGKKNAAGFPVLTQHLVCLEPGSCIIPNVCIHFERNMNSGMEYNAQTDMAPIFAVDTEGKIKNDEDAQKLFWSVIAKNAGVKPETIMGSDLYICNPEKGAWIGLSGDMIASPRLDDLQCVFGTFRGFVAAGGSSRTFIGVHAVLDNEEVGSTTRQGAASTFLKDTLVRLCECLGIGGQDYLRLIADSFMVSADNAHAVHPNHPEKSDAGNRPYMNGGIVIKSHGGQKYTSDGYSIGVFSSICKEAGVPCQMFSNRSDIAGGSTLGNISNTQVSVKAVDIGLPQLAMHSAYETAGALDTQYLVDAMTRYYRL